MNLDPLQKDHWESRARKVFDTPRPAQFTDPEHCLECRDHNETLIQSDIDHIGFKELGNPAWDPICFINNQGYLYYFPALIRLCLESDEDNNYISQLLFQLTYDGEDNARTSLFNLEQRRFVLEFLNFLLDTKCELLEQYGDESAFESAVAILENDLD